MSAGNYAELAEHQGHLIVVATYGDQNAAVECETCHVVLFDYDRLHEPEVKVPPKPDQCPHCRAEDSLEVLVDAFVVYGFKGFDDSGLPKRGVFQRTDMFDEIWVQCQECGERADWHDWNQD